MRAASIGSCKAKSGDADHQAGAAVTSQLFASRYTGAALQQQPDACNPAAVTKRNISMM
jgi:hypothetical protein